MEGKLKMANTNKTLQIVRLANEIAELQDEIEKHLEKNELGIPRWIIDKIIYLAGYSAALKAGEVAELKAGESDE